MKKEWLLAALSVVVTLAISLGVVRWFAPQLIGVPPDMQMVRVGKEVPPFFEGIFRREDLQSTEANLQDPYTGVRGKPLYPDLGWIGPNDMLGFRNLAVPNVADILVIGDSQTYGNNAVITQNWPGHLAARFSDRKATMYTMSVGGWGAVQYLYAASNATVFKPRVMIVAFYTGNDPLESFKIAYNYDIWSDLRVDPSLTASDAPSVPFPAPESELWPVQFRDGTRTVFTPALRHASNMEQPAVQAGYKIMAEVARRIVAMARPLGIETVFTIIPTKELVYERKILQDGVQATSEYEVLIRSEKSNIHFLADEIRRNDGTHYVDVVDPLQLAALASGALHPADSNGHPRSAGYQVIADAVGDVLENMLTPPVYGIYGWRDSSTGDMLVILMNRDGVWLFNDLSLVVSNGWGPENIPMLPEGALRNRAILGFVTEIDPEKYGPGSL